MGFENFFVKRDEFDSLKEMHEYWPEEHLAYYILENICELCSKGPKNLLKSTKYFFKNDHKQ